MPASSFTRLEFLSFERSKIAAGDEKNPAHLESFLSVGELNDCNDIRCFSNRTEVQNGVNFFPKL